MSNPTAEPMTLAELDRRVAADPQKYVNNVAGLLDDLGRYSERDEVMALWNLIKRQQAALDYVTGCLT